MREMTDEERQFRKRFRELSSCIYYGELEPSVQISILRKRPEGKLYVYGEVMDGAGTLEIIICVTDRCIDCIYEDNFFDTEEISGKILEKVLEQGAKMDWYARYYEEKARGNWPMQMPLDEKLTSGFIEAYVPSLDHAAYLQSIGHQFREEEKATIIANHECLSAEEKLEALRRMEELTEDEELRERLAQAQQLIEDDQNQRTDAAWKAFCKFFFIPHDFRHGDIVRFVGKWYHRLAGVVLGYDERDYEFYRMMRGDYSDIQVAVDTPFLIEEYDQNYLPQYQYLGGFAHKHVNPIYIERARMGHDDPCAWYMEYLAACDTPGEKKARSLAMGVITGQIGRTWIYYPSLSLVELMASAAKESILCREQRPIKELLEKSKIKLSDIRDYELMDGLFQMLPEDRKKELWEMERD